MPVIDDLNERRLCQRTPLCPNLVAIKNKTANGRIEVRNVCSWHYIHDTDDVPPASGAGAPLRGGLSFVPRNCEFPTCPRSATSLGLRQGRRFYSKWCAKHRDKAFRDLQFA